MNTTPNPTGDGHPSEMPAACGRLFKALVEVVHEPARTSQSLGNATTAATGLAQADPGAAKLLRDYLASEEGKYIKCEGEIYGSNLRPKVLNVLRSMLARLAARDALDEIEGGKGKGDKGEGGKGEGDKGEGNSDDAA